MKNRTNKAQRYFVWYCESNNKGLSCVDYERRAVTDERLKSQCVHAAYCSLGTICMLKQVNTE